MEGRPMIQYTLNRLLWLIPTILVMSAIVFFVSHNTPGSPLDPSIRGGSNALSPEQLKNITEKYGLDKPLWVQYRTFLWNALHLDFGTSYIYKTRDVSDILKQTFPISLQLGSAAMILAIVVGTFLGAIAAINQNSIIDYVSAGIAVLGTSLPNFVIAVLLVLVFSLTLKWVPPIGWETAQPKTLILPTLVLAAFPIATLTRYTRSSMVDIIRSDFVRTARAKGLAERRIIVGHVMKNALIPVVTVIGPLFAAVGTGSFVVEQIFAINGMGKFFVTSMITKDYPMIMAVILCYGVFLAVMNLVVDLLYGVLDPRIRLQS
jgi:ABC-type dipeptide/oligopeptide/nickel transport system permease component